MDSKSTKIDTTTTVDPTTTYSLLVSLITLIALTAGGYFAYQQGYLDPLIEKVGALVFKAKAKAEAKEMQTEGLTAGKDFVGCKFTFMPTPPRSGYLLT
jgi:hypothetical protein